MEDIAVKIRRRYYEDPVRDLETKAGYRTQREILGATHHTDKKAAVAEVPRT